MDRERHMLASPYREERHHAAHGRGQAAAVISATDVDRNEEPQDGNVFGFGRRHGHARRRPPTTEEQRPDPVREVRARARWI